MHLRGLVKPHVAVYSSALVEPALGFSRIDIYDYHIISAVIQEIGYIILKRSVSALMSAYKEIVDIHNAVPIYTVKRYVYSPSQIACINKKVFSVPSDILLKRACRRMNVPHCIHLGNSIVAPELLHRIFIRRTFYHKIMRKLNPSPCAVIEISRLRSLIPRTRFAPAPAVAYPINLTLVKTPAVIH